MRTKVYHLQPLFQALQFCYCCLHAAAAAAITALCCCRLGLPDCVCLVVYLRLDQGCLCCCCLGRGEVNTVQQRCHLKQQQRRQKMVNDQQPDT